MMKTKEAALKASIVLIPSYTAAYLTEQMVWVVPTLAAAGFFAGTISLDQKVVRRRLDEDDANEEGPENEVSGTTAAPDTSIIQSTTSE